MPYNDRSDLNIHETVMTRREDAAIIDPRKGRKEASLPSLAIMIFTSSDMELFLRCLSHPHRRTHRIFLADVHTGTCDDGTEVALAGPMLGAPQAVMVLEKLIALGARDILAVGWCGALQEAVLIGDVVLPTGAVSEEGTSAHYPLGDCERGPSVGLHGPLGGVLRREGFAVHEGEVWSTDAPYRETLGKVAAYRGRGVLGVEMEAAALLTVARYREVRLAMALTVSDDLSRRKWVHGFKEPRFHETRENLARVILGTMAELVAPNNG